MASVRKRKNSYQITVSNGRDVNGKQIIETATWTPDPERTERQNQKALDKFVIEFEDKVKSGRFLDGGKLTYKDYIDIWRRDYAKKQLQETSIERCNSSLNNTIIPAIGHLKLSEIRPLHIQALYDSMSTNGYISNGKKKSYSNNTIKRVHQIISSTLNTAVYWQLIESNPCSRVKPPKVEKQVDVKHFTLDQAQIFLKYLDEPYLVSHGGRCKRDGSSSAKHVDVRTVPFQFKVFFVAALYGGFRRGELVALNWSDIDFNDNTISITKTAARTSSGTIVKIPKTYSSNRDVVMSEYSIELFKQYKKEQDAYKLSLGSYWNGSDYIFIQDDGSMMDLSTPNHVFKKIINRYNSDADHEDPLPAITLHGLRHTSASLLIAENVDVKTVSNRLGHSETSTTMDIYAHALKKRDESAAESLGKLFGN